MKTTTLLAVALVVLITGCGATEQLVKKVDMLEEELSDLRDSQDRMNRRLDEMQIQLSILTKKQSSSFESKNIKVPSLAVVKLKPGSKKKKKAPSSKPIRLKAVDPYKVKERLSVDYNAARRPLFIVHEQEDDESEDVIAEKKFKKAYAFYQASDFTKAVVELRKFRQGYPSHPLVADALYWLGLSWWSLGDFQSAHRDFVVLAQSLPKNRRAPEALLMAGRCQEKLRRPRDARSTYLQLVQAYPLSQQAAEANQRLQSLN
jgi:tol-pal system protein YbgF